MRQVRLALDSAGRLTDIAVDHGEFHRLDGNEMAQALLTARGLGANQRR